MMTQIYYHITKFHNLGNVLKTGLKQDREGFVYIFDNIDVAPTIAITQLGLKVYALIEIDSKGINSIDNDNVGELTSRFQFRVNHTIKPEYLKLKGFYEVV